MKPFILGLVAGGIPVWFILLMNQAYPNDLNWWVAIGVVFSATVAFRLGAEE